jgi:hypothetical protein
MCTHYLPGSMWSLAKPTVIGCSDAALHRRTGRSLTGWFRCSRLQGAGPQVGPVWSVGLRVNMRAALAFAAALLVSVSAVSLPSPLKVHEWVCRSLCVIAGDFRPPPLPHPPSSSHRNPRRAPSFARARRWPRPFGPPRKGLSAWSSAMTARSRGVPMRALPTGRAAVCARPPSTSPPPPSPSCQVVYCDWRDVNWNAPDQTVKDMVDGGFNVIILAFFLGGAPVDMLQACRRLRAPWRRNVLAPVVAA